jgi:hypothetical protein
VRSQALKQKVAFVASHTSGAEPILGNIARRCTSTLQPLKEQAIHVLVLKNMLLQSPSVQWCDATTVAICTNAHSIKITHPVSVSIQTSAAFL